MKKFILITILLLSQFFGTVFADECIQGNCVNGQGTYTFANGDLYMGEHEDGKRTGQGTYTWINGTQYVGGFKDGKYHGQGTITLASGTTRTGIWENGEYLGQ